MKQQLKSKVALFCVVAALWTAGCKEVPFFNQNSSDQKDINAALGFSPNSGRPPACGTAAFADVTVLKPASKQKLDDKVNYVNAFLTNMDASILNDSQSPVKSILVSVPRPILDMMTAFNVRLDMHPPVMLTTIKPGVDGNSVFSDTSKAQQEVDDKCTSLRNQRLQILASANGTTANIPKDSFHGIPGCWSVLPNQPIEIVMLNTDINVANNLMKSISHFYTSVVLDSIVASDANLQGLLNAMNSPPAGIPDMLTASQKSALGNIFTQLGQNRSKLVQLRQDLISNFMAEMPSAIKMNLASMQQQPGPVSTPAGSPPPQVDPQKMAASLLDTYTKFFAPGGDSNALKDSYGFSTFIMGESFPDRYCSPMTDLHYKSIMPQTYATYVNIANLFGMPIWEEINTAN